MPCHPSSPRIRSISRWLVLALLAAGTTVPAAAQARKVSLRTLCFQHVGGVREVLLVTGSRRNPKTTPVRLYTSNYSDAVEATVRGNRLVFAVRIQGPDGEERLKTVAKGTLAPGPRQLAIFLPSREPGLPYSLKVIDESEAAFPMGSTLIYNLTATSARFTIGEYGRELKPGALGLIPRPTALNPLNQCTVRVFLADREGVWQPVTSTVWQSSPKLRNFALATIHPRTREPTVNSFQETPPWRLPQL